MAPLPLSCLLHSCSESVTGRSPWPAVNAISNPVGKGEVEREGKGEPIQVPQARRQQQLQPACAASALNPILLPELLSEMAWPGACLIRIL